MNKAYFKYVSLLLPLFLLSSCNKDDAGDDYVPLVINTQADSGQVFQNQTLDISIFANDSNVPSDGTLTLSNPQSGSVQILDNGTSTRLDDLVRYTPSATFMGDDSFQYTICDVTGDSCSTATVTVTVLPFSPVNFDITQVPYPKLSDYNFFMGEMKNQEPVYGVLPYEPITPLFTDYAKKKRFVWMPNGLQAEYVGDAELLNFPVGSVLIKSFYYNNVLPANNTQIIETRLMIKKTDGWIFADYIWNEAQDEGLLDTVGDGGFVPVEWTENGVTRNINYRIPATSQCITCHKANFENAPIGVKPQNLNSDYTYADGVSNQLDKWIEQGYLLGNVPSDITTVVKWDDPSEPLDLRVRSYFDINCASCHSDAGHCNYRTLRFAYDLSSLDENIGICNDPDTPIPGYEDAKVVDPGNPENSILFFRLSTNEEQYRMPLLGRTIQHEEGVALIEEWINSLTQTCE
ncbi:MAG: Ig-like domain-containing protein [Bacteroidota bacterium]